MGYAWETTCGAKVRMGQESNRATAARTRSRRIVRAFGASGRNFGGNLADRGERGTVYVCPCQPVSFCP